MNILHNILHFCFKTSQFGSCSNRCCRLALAAGLSERTARSPRRS